MKQLVSYLNEVDMSPPSSDDKLLEVEKLLGINLPAQYRNFALLSNGYEGSIGDSYIAIWKVDELVELNDGYAVKEFAPHLIIFGSDGGDEAYAFDVENDMQIVNAPFIGLGLEPERLIAKTFDEFIEKIYNGL